MPAVLLDRPRPLRFLQLGADTPSVTARALVAHTLAGPLDVEATLDLAAGVQPSITTRALAAWRLVPDYVLEPTLDVSWPAPYTIHQRVGVSNAASIPIDIVNGSSPEPVEARLVTGAGATPWADIDAIWTDPGRGAGILEIASSTGGLGCHGTLEVRYVGAVDTVTVANIGIGDIMVAGLMQSNGAGLYEEDPPTEFSHPTVIAGLFRGADYPLVTSKWQQWDEHLNGSNNPIRTSVYTRLANAIAARTDFCVGIVTCAVGSTGFAAKGEAAEKTAWARGGYANLAAIEITNAARLTAAPLLGGVHQGEEEMGGGIIDDDPDVYFDAIVDGRDAFEEGIGFEIPYWIVVQTANRYDATPTAAQVQQVHDVRNVHERLWNRPDLRFFPGPVTCDQDHEAGGVHLTTLAQLETVATRWIHCVNVYAFGDSGGRGPRFLSATKTGNRTVRVVFQVDNGGAGMALGAAPSVGWRLTDASGGVQPKNYTSVAIAATTADTVAVDLQTTQNVVLPAEISWGYYNDASGATAEDSAGMGVEPWYEEAVA